jgi:hypothetical protein
MADSNTTNFGLVQPEVGASKNTWGSKLNDNLDDLDALVLGYFTAAGTANARTVTTGLSLSSIPTGFTIKFGVPAINTGAATLNVDGNGAVTMLRPDGTALPSGYLQTGAVLRATFNGTNWIVENVALDRVTAARQVIAGDGLFGGGNLTADRTLTVGAGDGIDVGTNTVGVNNTVVRTSRVLTAGNGITGGGNLFADRTFTLGTPGALSASSTDAVTTSSHTHSIDSSIARSAITITAGDGLSGGGNLTANRSVAVDATVVRTSSPQTIGGNKTFSNNVVVEGNGRFGQNSTASPGVTNTTTGAAFNDDGVLAVSRASGSSGRFNTNSSGTLIDFRRQGVLLGNIAITASDTDFVNLSDPSMKENITVAPDPGEVIDAIEVVEYDWISSGEHIRWGLLATDIAYHLPEAAFIPANPKGPWGYAADKLVPMLLREIQLLRQRVAALEG